MRTVIDRFRLFTVRELSAHRGRAIASIVVVAAATTLLVAVLSIITSINGAVDSLGDRLVGDASIEVTAASGAGVPAQIRNDIEAVEGVTVAVPIVQTTVTSASGDLTLMATDSSASKLHSPVQKMVTEHLGDLASRPGSVLAGPKSGFSEGESILVNGQEAKVAAVLNGDDAEHFNGGRYLFTAIQTARDLSGRGDVTDSYLVVVGPKADRTEVTRGIERAIGGRALVGPPSTERARTSNGVQLIRYVAISSAAMTFLVAGFLIYTTFALAVAGRRIRLSMLRALGGTRRALVGDMLAETALYAVVGAVGGSGLGLLVGQYAVGRLPAVFMQTLSARVAFSIPVWLVITGAVCSVLASVAAAAFAARAVYRVSPVEALVPAGVSRIDIVPRRLRIAAAVAGTILAGAAVVAASTQPGILANSGISVMFAAELAIAFAFGGQLVRATAAIAARCGGSGGLASETIARSPRRSWATLMVVAVAVAASLAISAGNTNAVDSTERSFAPLASADAWVTTSPPGTFAAGATLTPDLIEHVTQTPGVAGVLREQAMYVDLGSERAILFGLSGGSVNPMLSRVDHATAAKVTSGDGIILSTDLAEALNAKAGEDVTLATPTGAHRAKILATVPYFSGLSGAIASGYERIQDWYGTSGATALQITASPGAAPKIVDRLKAEVPDGVYAYSGAAAVGGFRDALAQATTLNHMIWMIVTAIAVIAVFNALFLSVLDRRREIGVLRAIGASRGFIVRAVFVEAGSIAIVGAVCGIVFGLVQQAIADIASSRAWNVDVEFALVPTSFGIALGVLMVCVLGAIPPALRASRLSVIETMRVE